MEEIAEHCANLPALDGRTADEILGYDEAGLPRISRAVIELIPVDKEQAQGDDFVHTDVLILDIRRE